MKFILEQKFKQHPEILEELLATNDCIILEASPWDRYWGVGYGMDDPRILNRASWGKNMLGQLLMEIRDKYLLRCKQFLICTNKILNYYSDNLLKMSDEKRLTINAKISYKAVTSKPGTLNYDVSSNSFILSFQHRGGTITVPLREVLPLKKREVVNGETMVIEIMSGNPAKPANELRLSKIQQADKQALHNLLLDLVGVKSEIKSNMPNGYRMSEPSTSACKSLPPQSAKEFNVPKQTSEDTNRRATVAGPPPGAIRREDTTMLNQIYQAGIKEMNGHVLPPRAGIRTVPESDRSKREREQISNVLLDEPARKAARSNGNQHEKVTLRKPVNGIVDLNNGQPKKPSPSKASPSKFSYKCRDGEIIGIPNIGNSCYMGCVLQSFFRTDLPGQLEQFLRELEDESKQKEEMTTNTCFSWAFLTLKNVPFDSRRDKMEKLRDIVLGLEPEKFCLGRQHDAHEFAVFLLERIRTETTQLLVHRPLNGTQEDIVHSLFNFAIRIEVICKACGITDERSEEGTHLILRIPDDEQNETSINELLHAALLNFGGDYTCGSCSAVFEKKRQWFSKFPRHLILMLQRYSYDEKAEKIVSSVHVNQDLFLLPPLQRERDAAEEDQNAIETSSPVRNSKSRHIRSIENFPHEISAIPGPSGIMEDVDCDVSIIKDRTIEKKTFAYKPVTNQWRKRVCNQLQLNVTPLQEDVYANYECAGQTSECRVSCAPEVLEDVDGDGNCLFRALAHIITGGEDEQHMELRTKICSFMKSHRTAFSRSFAKSEEEFDDHVQNMERRSTWGSESELFACATMLQTPISTYLDGRWVPYMPCFPLDDDSSPVIYSSVNRTTIDNYDDIIYLLNQCGHYSPVLSIPSRKYYQLKSVVTHIGRTVQRGHYTAFLGAEQNARRRVWVKCNDSTVVPVSETEATNECSTSGYILFYESSTESINIPNIGRRLRHSLKNLSFEEYF
ncbi:ubiquitin carboxyl-terminal hydrolase domain-containing protein [Ditylenchus destructor]|uniref:ubiquitinyl hydrolase 1 n=1 Tax=Ditylenchus destructor TaxID=166010 RepID=A0AAD4N7W6_9BILA|nr:ubiquitin carboxyl-terminal hydrolase domain-containing protein [Ditylenchus destructor]